MFRPKSVEREENRVTGAITYDTSFEVGVDTINIYTAQLVALQNIGSRTDMEILPLCMNKTRPQFSLREEIEAEYRDYHLWIKVSSLELQHIQQMAVSRPYLLLWK